MTIRHRSIPVPWGVVHVREAGESEVPIVCVHQTPRSGDEFREVMELLSPSHRVVAMDLPGMGRSTPHPDGAEITNYADAIVAACTADGIERCHLVGHHTGAAVAAQVAATQPSHVASLVLSSPPWMDAEARAARAAQVGPGIDQVEHTDAASYAQALWAGRASFYPTDRPDLLRRFVVDALLVADPTTGHRAVGRWRMEEVLAALAQLPVTFIDNQADPFAHPHIARWSAVLPDACVAVIADGMVPLEYTAEAFAAIVLVSTRLSPR
jgi:pimeloyl-ACP methyl ester carboxylesterase